MKKIIKTSVTLLVLVIGMMFLNCTGSFEEINTDPDAYPTAAPENMLTYMIRYAGEQYGGDLDGYGTWAGYIVKIRYVDWLTSLIPSNHTYGNRWTANYRVNSQTKTLLENTEESADAYVKVRFAARILGNYMWQYTTDAWRDIPYSEALLGAVEDGAIVQPKYDKQEDIYPAIMAELKKLADEMANEDLTDEDTPQDILFKGNMLKWQKFCNSLRLRMAIRISEVSPELAKSTIEEICGNLSKYPVIDENDYNAYLKWMGTPPYYEPWYDNSLDRDDHGISDIFIDHLKEMEDPRLSSIAHPAETDGEYRGYINGAADNAILASISHIGYMYRDDPAGFTPFFKACETYYILAEAALLGWNTGISAQDAYEKAVRLSMKDNEVSDADTEAYLAGKGKWDNTKERIWWDMWVGLFKNNHEAWCLYRRTGIPTTNYISINSVWGSAHNDQPFRLPYPENEYNFNEVNVKAAAANVVNEAWGEQMWWDTRTGVY